MVGAKLNTCYQRCNAGIYLLGYLVCPRALIQVPHAAIASLALRLDSQSHSQSNTYSTLLPRDLLVCLFVLPASLDWLLAGLTSWPGGEMWCQVCASFRCHDIVLDARCLFSKALMITLFDDGKRKTPCLLRDNTQMEYGGQ